MKLHFKKNILLLISTCICICGCLHTYEPPKGFTISEQEKSLIRKFATENGYPETMALDSFVRYVYDKWPNETDRIDYFLTLPKQNATPKMLVLTDILTAIGKGLRVHYEPAPYGGVISSANIDTIQIITDSVIVLPGLSLSYCNLMKLPPEIGKLRVSSLDIGDNLIKDLPLEIMSIFNHLPSNNGKIEVVGNPILEDYWDSIPDTLREWLIKHR